MDLTEELLNVTPVHAFLFSSKLCSNVVFKKSGFVWFYAFAWEHVHHKHKSPNETHHQRQVFLKSKTRPKTTFQLASEGSFCPTNTPTSLWLILSSTKPLGLNISPSFCFSSCLFISSQQPFCLLSLFFLF